MNVKQLASNFGAAAQSAGAQILSASAQQAAQRGDGSQVSAMGAMNANQMYNRVIQNAASNTAQSAAEAEKLRKWQEAQNQKAMDFNAAEAAKNRNWQEMMSNTAHQREVRDLMAAGLNPVLSAAGGNGASVGSGATASAVTSAGAKGDVDTSGNSALVSVLGSLLSLQSQLASSAMSAVSNQAIADKNNATSRLVADITGSYSLRGAQTSAAAQRYGADRSFEAQKYYADKYSDASKYHTDMQKYIAKQYPGSFTALAGSLGESYADALMRLFSGFDGSGTAAVKGSIANFFNALHNTEPRYRYYNRGAVK